VLWLGIDVERSPMHQPKLVPADHFAIAFRIAFAALVAVLLPGCAVVAAVTLAPFQLAASGPAPTLDAPEDPSLAERASGTLVIADGSGTVTLIDLPSCAERRLEIGGTVIAATAPDEAGRIAYLREEWPLPQAILAFCFGVGKNTTVLAVRSLDGGEERVLAEVRSNRPGRSIELSRRGGRVLHHDTHTRYDVFDLDSGARVQIPPLLRPSGTPRLDAEGRRLVYGRRAVNEIHWAGSVGRLDTWEIDLETGLERELHGGQPTSSDTLDEVTELALDYEYPPGSNSPPGRIGPCVFELTPDLVIYEGLPGPEAGAREYFSTLYPSFERSIRLGEREGSATMTLFPRFRTGTFAFTPQRFVN
jgi:hypothetical protein